LLLNQTKNYMKKLLLSASLFCFATLGRAQTTVVCNTFPDASNVSVYETPSTGYVTYNVNPGMNELNVAYNNAPSWADWATATAELKISFAATDITGLTTPVILYEIETNSVVLTGTSCGTSLPLGISVVDSDNDYSAGLSSNIGYWVGLDTAHFTGIDESTSSVNYAAITTIAIKPAIPAGCTVSGGFILKNVCLGELPVSSTTSASAAISTSKLYPNPVADVAKIEMTLKSISDVKITVSDMMGKEMMTITEGSMSSVDASFDVSNLNKGVYSVNYFVNGAAAKAELLMVK
jgi:hypothetical protein